MIRGDELTTLMRAGLRQGRTEIRISFVFDNRSVSSKRNVLRKSCPMPVT